MSTPLERAWTASLHAMLGAAGSAADEPIMAAQLERAARTLQRPPMVAGSLFETEPATFFDRLAALAAEDKS